MPSHSYQQRKKAVDIAADPYQEMRVALCLYLRLKEAVVSASSSSRPTANLCRRGRDCSYKGDGEIDDFLGVLLMREIAVDQIAGCVERLCLEANYSLPPDVKEALELALAREESPLGKEVLRDILANAEIAHRDRVPLCQDTGFAVVFLEVGQEVLLTGGDLREAINEGVRRAYTGGYLRKSIVADPFLTRRNTGDNTPAIVHTEIVPGDTIRITLIPKGAGSENMSSLRMLKPADGVDGIKQLVLEVVDRAGPNPCPPLIVGVGIGGTMEMAALQAKKALLRPVGQHHPRAEVAELEAELLEEINRLGVGPMGLGGRITALAVHVETFPAHIATLPVAVNLQCHANRHRTTTI